MHGIALEAQWIPRSLNGMADLLRRFIDENDSPVNPYVFRVVEAKWGPRTNLNRFTSYYRVLSFRVLTPSLPDAFVRDWSGKDNWIFLSSGSRSVSLIWYICVPGLAYLYGMWPGLAYFLA